VPESLGPHIRARAFTRLALTHQESHETVPIVQTASTVIGFARFGTVRDATIVIILQLVNRTPFARSVAAAVACMATGSG